MSPIDAKDLKLSFLETVRSSEVVELAGDLVDAYAGFPIAAVGKKGYESIREYFFQKKVIELINSLGEMAPLERQKQLDKLLTNSAERERFAEQLLHSLERYDDVRKATIMGNLLIGLMRNAVSLAEFWRMSRAVEAISLDEEWPVLQVIERYNSRYYEKGHAKLKDWRHEGVLLDMVKEELPADISDGDLRSIAMRLNQTGLYSCLGWREGPAHDCEIAPWYYKLKPYMYWQRDT